MIKDSGERRAFDTGAVRDMSEGKGRYDLLPWFGIEAVAQVMEEGASKYGERNWESGIPTGSFCDSATRHLAKFMRGEVDEPHLAQAAWNILCALETRRKIQLGVLPATLDTAGAKVSAATASGCQPVSHTPVATVETQAHEFCPNFDSLCESNPCVDCDLNNTTEEG